MKAFNEGPQMNFLTKDLDFLDFLTKDLVLWTWTKFTFFFYALFHILPLFYLRTNILRTYTLI